MPSLRLFLRTHVLLAVGGFALLTGCSSLSTQPTGNADTAKFLGSDASATQVAQQGPQYTVEIREAGKDPEFVRLPMKGNTFVDNAIRESGATKRFKRMNVELIRNAGGQPQRLEVRYDRAKKGINPVYDYALHPGDHVVVIEDTRTAIDDMMDGVSSRMGLSNLNESHKRPANGLRK